MKIYLLTLLACILVSFPVLGQTSASLYGTVKDAKTGETIPQCNIIVEGTSVGTMTDLDGRYNLLNIAEGSYTIRVSFIGYTTQSKEITLAAGQRLELNISLEMDMIGLLEVSVYAQLMGQREAISRQVNALGVVNVVSSDRMRELPDVNAAEAIGRLPGVSINRTGGEGTSVVLRGLDPKLTSVTINNIRVPSSDANNRSVNLSMISPELLSDIEVFKSPTADMDGDAIGGIINLGVSKAPAMPTQQVRIYGGYNSLKSDLNNYKGSFNLSQRFVDDKIGVIVRGNFENTNRSSESLSIGWERKSDQDTILSTSGVTVQDTKRLTKRVGANVQADYTYKSGQVIFQSFFSQRNVDINSLTNSLGTIEGNIIHNPRSARFTDQTIQNFLSGKQKILGIEADWVVAHSNTRSTKPYDIRMSFQQPNAFDSQIRGQHVSDPAEILKYRRFDYSSSYLFRYFFEPDESNHANLTAALDLKKDYRVGSWIKGFIKTGVKFRKDDRSYTQDHQMVYWYYQLPEYVFRAANLYPGQLILGGPDKDKIMISNFFTSDAKHNIWKGDAFFLHPNLDRSLVDRWHDTQNSELKTQFESAYLDYDVVENVYAGYIMGTIDVGQWLRIVPGVRYEHSDNAYTGWFSSLSIHGTSGSKRDTTTFQNYGEWLPNIHMKISPLRWLDLRVSAVKTISRPDYNMVTPRTWLDLTNGNLRRGNPDLRHAKAWNYDAGITLYSSRLGLLSIGGFYKKFDDYFTNISRSMSSTEATSLGLPPSSYDVRLDYMNFDNSEVKGIEIDLQTNLSFLPGAWRGVVINTNLSRMWSKTFYPLFVPIRVWNPATRRYVVDYEASYFDLVESPLPSQVDLIANVSLGYDMKGFSARVSMVYQGSSLRGFRAGGTEEALKYSYNYADEYLRFDASLSKKIGDHITILASLANISGAGEKSYRYLQQYTTNNNKYGPFYELGLQYRF